MSHGIAKSMNMVVTLLTWKFWNPVLASSTVKFVFFWEYSDGACTTPLTRNCGGDKNGYCSRALDSCNAVERWKLVEKNNKIVQESFNSAGCSGSPEREDDFLGGATINSATCHKVSDGQSYKDLEIKQIPLKETGVERFYSDSACNQPYGGTFPITEYFDGKDCSSHAALLNHLKSQSSKVPNNAVAVREICKGRKRKYAFYEAATCAGCPKLLLDHKETNPGSCQKPYAQHWSMREGCENQADSQDCLPAGGKSTNTTSMAAGKTNCIMALLMFGALAAE